MNMSAVIKIAREMAAHPNSTQRALSERSRLSVGMVNKTIQSAVQNGYMEHLESGVVLTDKGRALLEGRRVDNAIILAAGFGARCIPLTYETPKGLIKIKGKPMLERQIEQLLEAGVTEIILVVGYMKERFDYLADRYGVKLVYNPEYATKNNLASLYYALDYLRGSYVLCADNWMERNVFHLYEPESWFSCLFSKGPTDEWVVARQRTGRITKLEIGGANAFTIVGPAYFSRDFSRTFSRLTRQYYAAPGTQDYYWEQILKDHLNELPMVINDLSGDVHEFENLAELRQYDTSYLDNSNNPVMQSIAQAFGIREGEVGNILVLKEGVTNNSFRFTVAGKEYVYRRPGIGTEKQMDRRQECHVYKEIKKLGIADQIVYFNENSGIKISEYYPNAVIADPFSDDDLAVCMQQIRKVHESGARAAHGFNIDKKIDYFQSLAEEIDAIRFEDIAESKNKLKELLDLRDRLAIKECLCHGDFAHTNVLMLPNGDSRVIDWEFAGMGDAVMDVAMYAIFAQFDHERIRLSLQLYCGKTPTREEYTRLYLYVALGGYLWSMWSQYKQGLGQEFGEYPLVMYRYMKNYYKRLKSASFSA